MNTTRKVTNVSKITVCGVLIALGVVLPQLSHIFGPQVSKVFLAMHFPVLIAGLFAGPAYGAIVGIITPVISFFITGMPPVPMLYFMIVELAVYGAAGGLFAILFKKYPVVGTYISLVLAMILGRLAYVLVFTIFTGINSGNFVMLSSIVSLATGVPGVILQIVIVPPIVLFLRHLFGRNREII